MEDDGQAINSTALQSLLTRPQMARFLTKAAPRRLAKAGVLAPPHRELPCFLTNFSAQEGQFYTTHLWKTADKLLIALAYSPY